MSRFYEFSERLNQAVNADPKLAETVGKGRTQYEEFVKSILPAPEIPSFDQIGKSIRDPVKSRAVVRILTLFKCIDILQSEANLLAEYERVNLHSNPVLLHWLREDIAMRFSGIADAYKAAARDCPVLTVDSEALILAADYFQRGASAILNGKNNLGDGSELFAKVNARRLELDAMIASLESEATSENHIDANHPKAAKFILFMNTAGNENKSERQIARELGINERTVSRYIDRFKQRIPTRDKAVHRGGRKKKSLDAMGHLADAQIKRKF